MATERQTRPFAGFAVRPDRPLIGVVVIEDGQEVVRYFASEDEFDAAIAASAIEDVRSLAGAWADLDWEEALDELDRIRHDNPPTPPIDDL